MDELETDNPTKEQLIEFTKRTIEEGRVVPGYGHAVLRKPILDSLHKKSLPISTSKAIN